ncbi:sensor histidine kinase [Zavarzinia sp. CC-PAN008]|uniref:sensor histidine kinase n=1 Tax=Zavarzinia sp. CC-PAN008 TaxID=3243332 RepID=UPI003F7486BE
MSTPLPPDPSAPPGSLGGVRDSGVHRLTQAVVRPFLPSAAAVQDSAPVALVIYMLTVAALIGANAGIALLIQPAISLPQWLAYAYTMAWPVACCLLLRHGWPIRTVLAQAAAHGTISVLAIAGTTGGVQSPALVLLIAGLASTGVAGTPGLTRRAALGAIVLAGLLLLAELLRLLPPDPVPPHLRSIAFVVNLASGIAIITQASAAAAHSRATIRAERAEVQADLVRLNRELDARVAARTTELEAARVEAEQASLGKSRFLAQMSHELRTPLNAVIGFAEIMRMGLFGPAGSPRYTQYVAHVEDSGRHLLSLVNDLLDLSRLDAGEFALKVEQVDLDETIAAAQTLVATKAEAQGVVLERAAEDRRGVAVWADRRALRQALANILANAVKFTGSGDRIVVTVEGSVEGVTIRIDDTGCGMPPDKVASLLSGVRAHDAMARDEREGAGLGFAITRGLLARHGGRVELESTPGRGTSVRLVLPAERVLTAPVAA